MSNLTTMVERTIGGRTVNGRAFNGRARLRPSRPGCINNNRNGAVLIAVLVCVTVAGAILAAMASRMLLTHRQLRIQSLRNQTHWLSEAGLDRAVQKTKTEPNYQGETWTIPSADLQDRGDAKVEITIEKSDDGQQIQVVTRFPVGSNNEVQATRTIMIPNPENLNNP